jgi:fumarate hydratase class II
VEEVLYGKQTRLARDNFPFSDFRFSRPFLRALGLIKQAAAESNASLGMMDQGLASAIAASAAEVAAGQHDDQFVLDVFQTGSGTSTNMNANEVIATLASQRINRAVHPNDDVNRGQSSNDVIPTAIHVSAAIEVASVLLPALLGLQTTIESRAAGLGDVVKSGRTHLMDAVPMTMAQELGAWADTVRASAEAIAAAQTGLLKLAIGGTAIGTGLNAHPQFGQEVSQRLEQLTGFSFQTAPNRFALISTQGPALALSAALRGASVALLKIANDLRWMNSGPAAGLGEIHLAELQAGSSIMPGKVNPVLAEAAVMLCLQVQAHDMAVCLGAQAGNFQLNTALPLIAWNLLSAIRLLTSAAQALAQAIESMEVDRQRIARIVALNSIVVTALAPRIGYDACAAIVKDALATGRSVLELAIAQTGIREEELRELLDPARMIP